MVLHEPRDSVGLVIPEGGEGPCRYVVGLVGPHEVPRRITPRFPCKHHTGLYRNVISGVPHVLILHFFASGEAFLKAILILDVLVVKLLLTLVKIADSFDLLCDEGSLGGRLGEGLFGAAAFGPIVRIALGVAVGFLDLDGLLPALLSNRLRPVEAVEDDLLASKLLPGQMVLRLLP